MKVPWKRGIVLWGQKGCGKTTTLKILMSQYQLKPVTIQSGHPEPNELLQEAFKYAQEHAPSLLFFEDLQELMKVVDARHFLNLLDGVQTRDGMLVVATGNDFSSLEENLTNRPRRFDKKIEYPLPNRDMSVKYLKRWLDNIVEDDVILEIAASSVKQKFTYTHLQEVYFNSVAIAINKNREQPIQEDVKESLKQIIAEKKSMDKMYSSKPVSMKGYDNE
jgi:ATP-dependent 26S proteasome regulatory subunit